MSVFGDFVAAGSLLREFHRDVCITLVCRNANKLAHEIARVARDFESPNS